MSPNDKGSFAFREFDPVSNCHLIGLLCRIAVQDCCAGFAGEAREEVESEGKRF